MNWYIFNTDNSIRIKVGHLPEKGRKEIEEIVEEMKERDRKERGTGMKVTEDIKPLTLYPYPLQGIAGLAHLKANISWTPRWCKIHNTFTSPNHPNGQLRTPKCSAHLFEIASLSVRRLVPSALGFLINVQVQGQHTHQWAHFQIAGLLHAWQISHQIARYVYHEGW